MKPANAALEAILPRWLDDGEASALAEACALAKAQPVDVDALLRWVAGYGATAQATDLAIRRLRFALGLPVIPGPVCRVAP